MKNNRSITIGWLYPELMNTYGDRGNIICLKRRCEWHGIKCNVLNLEIGFSKKDILKADFIFMGGAQDQQQQIVAKDLFKNSDILKQLIESGTPGLYICGAYQFLGRYYKDSTGKTIKGLGIFDLYTEHPGQNEKRLIGNIAVETEYGTLLGFENHGGKTILGKNIKPLGKVISGFGNNGKDKTEGAIYKNSFGSYLHGPILPKNPKFTDHLIKLAYQNKYKEEMVLENLDDKIENLARKTIAQRLKIEV